MNAKLESLKSVLASLSLHGLNLRIVDIIEI